MALRILPFRQYSDHDVINLFSVIGSDVNDKTTDSGAGDAGVFVKVADGNFDADPITYQTNAYLGETSSVPFLGTTEMYPEVNLKITGAKDEDHCIGMTLYQTAKKDENEEKLLYNPQKREELQVMLPGQAVPIATKGVFTLSSSAFDGPLTDYAPGNRIKLSSNAGKITGFSTVTAATITTGDLVDEDKVFGHVLGTGTRPNEGNTTDQFSGDYIVVSFDCN